MEEKEIDVKRLDGAPQIGHRGTKHLLHVHNKTKKVVL
jgi:hypothetical protein